MVADVGYNQYFLRLKIGKNIINLIYETFERLAIAETISAGEIVSSACLWELTDNIMTDAVSKDRGRLC